MEAKKKIDFYEKSKAYKKGKFSSNPIEDAIIHAYGITENEIEPFRDPKYFDVHWTDIFAELMANREKKN